MHECQRIGIPNVDVDDVYLGNGVSELIVMATQALLNPGDEILVPAPDYPLWTAAVLLAGGVPIHYRCDEKADWYPDLQDIQAKTTSRTKAMVVINPNNPTGAGIRTQFVVVARRLGATTRSCRICRRNLL